MRPDRHFDHLMSASNLTTSDPSTFILQGLPGLEAAHAWISIPFAMFYIISLFGNFMVLFVVCKEKILHKPMYLLLCMLALTDISLTTSVIPKALCIFWFNLEVITVGGCLTQTFFLHTVTIMHQCINFFKTVLQRGVLLKYKHLVMFGVWLPVELAPMAGRRK
uniref:G-protein coupled receptors family 1 profile domain-containing protein n=1 Tax=Chelydra serpentina TaxID=8475 RepID=A0A8C3S461_CHESE